MHVSANFRAKKEKRTQRLLRNHKGNMKGKRSYVQHDANTSNVANSVAGSAPFT